MRSIILIISIIILFPNFLFSQYYSFSFSNGAYTELDNPVSLNNGQVWNVLELGFPIGFNFPYFNSVVDSLFFFQDGSSSTLSSSREDGGIHQLFIPFGAALVDRGYGTSVSQSPLSYKLIGLPGNRVLKIEWKNAGLYGELQFNGTTSDFINFQMWLYEISGNIEIHYGPSLFNYPQFDFTFESGPAISLIPSYDWDQDIICDMTGRKVYNASINLDQVGDMQIPVSDLTNGIYQLIIKQGKETYTSRFVKL